MSAPEFGAHRSGAGGSPAAYWPIFTAPMLVATGVPLLSLLALCLAGVPLGRPRFVYPYSQLALIYLIRAIPAMLLVIPLLRGTKYLAAPDAPTRRRGLLTCAAAAALISGWTYVAPVEFRGRYIFEMHSPSHEGAFLLEAQALKSNQIVTRDGERVRGVRAYLLSFHELLLRTPANMRGTRILSNPPGMTLVALSIAECLDRVPMMARAIERILPGDPVGDADLERWFTVGLSVSALLHALWVLSLAAAYGLARLWLAPPAAMVAALAMVFNPATVNFTPGKDPAQLLLALAFLYLWFAAGQRRRPLLAGLSGAVLVIGSTFSLVFVWVALIAGLSSAWLAGTDRRKLQELAVRSALSAVVGAITVVLLARLSFGWNLGATLSAVARRYGGLQGDVITHPLSLNLIGLGLFVLFAGPVLWAAPIGLWRDRFADEPARLGRAMLVLTASVLAYTYVFANNAETPRLWIPFIPMVVLPVALHARIFRAPDANRGVRILLGLLVLQVAGTLLHRSLLDVRETELRMATGRGFL